MSPTPHSPPGTGSDSSPEFATKPEVAQQMIHTALARVPGAWVAGDEDYGRTPGLRTYRPHRECRGR